MKKNLKNNLSIIITSILLGIVTTFEYLIKTNPNKIKFLNNINFFILLIIIILLSFIYYFPLKYLIKKLSLINISHQNYNDKQIKKIFIISSISMFLIWLICYITVFPGGGDYDTYYQLSAPGAASTQHPIVHSYLLNFFIVKLGYNILGSSIAGWAIFSFLQMCFIIFTLSYTICFLAKRNLNKYLIFSLIIIYTFIPIYATYSLFAVKDVLFATILIYIFLLLIKLVETKGKILQNKKYVFLYIFLSTSLYFIRSNAFIIYILSTLAIIIYYHKYLNKYFIIIFLIPILLNYSVNKITSMRYHVKHYFQESMAIPLQQISATVYTDGSLTEQEKDFINNLLTIEEIKASYNPQTVDAIKWHSNFNREYLEANKLRFLKYWTTILVKNFDTYVESYALQTEGYWTISNLTSGKNMYYDTQTGQTDGFVGRQKDEYNIYCDNLLPTNIQNKLETFYHEYTTFLSGGICFWLTIISMLVTIYKKKSAYLITYIPILSVWLSMMVAAPLASSERYMFPFTLMLPIIIVFSLNLKKENIK